MSRLKPSSRKSDVYTLCDEIVSKSMINNMYQLKPSFKKLTVPKSNGWYLALTSVDFYSKGHQLTFQFH